MSKRGRETGFKDSKGREIHSGDVVGFANDYPGGMLEPDEPHNDRGVVRDWSGQRGFEVDLDTVDGNREKGSWPIRQLIDDYGELEILATLDDADWGYWSK